MAPLLSLLASRQAVDNAAGASGASSGGTGISQGALIAIIVVVCAVGFVGISMAVLFYVAKKREWQVRDKLRRSVRRVKTAMTPRRSEFPSSVKGGGSAPSSRARARLDDVPPTPRLRPEDVEKNKLAAAGRPAKLGQGWAAHVNGGGGGGRGKNYWPGH